MCHTQKHTAQNKSAMTPNLSGSPPRVRGQEGHLASGHQLPFDGQLVLSGEGRIWLSVQACLHSDILPASNGMRTAERSLF